MLASEYAREILKQVEKYGDHPVFHKHNESPN